MTRAELIEFLRSEKLGVQTSIAADGSPQAAVVGYAVSDDLEIVFDTSPTSRKAANYARDARAAFVVWRGETTAQLEGRAEIVDDARLREVYYAVWPDGRARAMPIVRIRVTWARFSDFTAGRIEEL